MVDRFAEMVRSDRDRGHRQLDGSDQRCSGGWMGTE
jgi:hypothetical protein